MQTYIGYGFDTSVLTDDDWAHLVRKYDFDAYRDAIDEVCRCFMPDEELRERCTEAACIFIDDNNISRADYLRDIINGNENKIAGTDYIVTTYDDYLCFDSVRFADDSPRTRYIKTQEDFIKMITKYIPTENITFGNIYEGTDWIDPNYYMD